MITMLPDGKRVREAVLEALPALNRRHGSRRHEARPIRPPRARSARARRARTSKWSMRRCRRGAEAIDGTLTIMVGGTEAAMARASGAGEARNRIVHVGPLRAPVTR